MLNDFNDYVFKQTNTPGQRLQGVMFVNGLNDAGVMLVVFIVKIGGLARVRLFQKIHECLAKTSFEPKGLTDTSDHLTRIGTQSAFLVQKPTRG